MQHQLAGFRIFKAAIQKNQLFFMKMFDISTDPLLFHGRESSIFCINNMGKIFV